MKKIKVKVVEEPTDFQEIHTTTIKAIEDPTNFQEIHKITDFFKMFIKVTFYFISACLFTTCLTFLIAFALNNYEIVINLLKHKPYDITPKLLSSMTYLSFYLLFYFLGIVLFLVGKAVEKETDKNYVSSLFSAIVALSALIISVVQFFK